MICKSIRAPLFVAALSAFVAIPGLAFADSTPSYPNAALKSPETPRGSPLFQLETADAVAKVDAWYGEHLPKTCTHQTAKGGAKYACPGVNIMITPDQGKTLITHMSSMGGMFGR